MSGTTNAPYWPLSQTYFSPAAYTGICLVDLCQGVQQGGPPPVCTAIFATCAQGSTSFTPTLNGTQSFPCGYQSMNVTLASGDTSNIACGLIPIIANYAYDKTGGIVLTNPNINLVGLINTTATDLSSLGVSVWPTSAINLTPVLSTIAPFLYGSSVGTGAKSAASKDLNLPNLAVTAGLGLTLLISALF